MDYKDDVFIDESSLDIEWLEQPSLVIKYGQIVADMELRLGHKKMTLDITKAGIDKDVRTSPGDYGIEKITETVVSNAILEHPDYQEAHKSVLEAQYEYNVARTALTAIIQRKDALENLVRLHGQQYFAGPSVPRQLAQKRKEKEETIDSKIGMKMKRGKSKVNFS